MLSKIIVPLDGSPLSERILPFCVDIAKATNGSITLVQVVDPADIGAIEEPGAAIEPGNYRIYADTSVGAVPQPVGDNPEQFANLEQVMQNALQHTLEYLLDQKRLLSDVGVNAEVKGLLGKPAEAIVGFARESGAGLIAMSTHGRTGLDRAMMGSVADEVLHSGDVPLVLFSPHESVGRSIDSIILPMDGSEFAAQAKPMAIELARSLHVPLTVMHIVDLGVALGQASSEYPNSGIDPIVLEAEEDKARDLTQSMTRELQNTGVDFDTVILRGDPSNQIEEYAGQKPGALIVMSTHGRSGIERLVMGSVADKVARGSGNPVLLIRAKAPVSSRR